MRNKLRSFDFTRQTLETNCTLGNKSLFSKTLHLFFRCVASYTLTTVSLVFFSETCLAIQFSHDFIEKNLKIQLNFILSVEDFILKFKLFAVFDVTKKKKDRDRYKNFEFFKKKKSGNILFDKL